MNKKTDAIGFRKVYSELVFANSLTTVFRLNRSKYKDLYCCGRIVEGRIITEPGNSRLNIEPVYESKPIYLIAKSVTLVALEELKPADFVGSSPDVQDIRGLIYHLGLIYNRSTKEFTPQTKVIRIELEYV